MILPDRANKSTPASQKLPLQGVNFFDSYLASSKLQLLQLLISQQLLCHVLLLNGLYGLKVVGRTLGSAQDKFSSGVVELDSASWHVL